MSRSPNILRPALQILGLFAFLGALWLAKGVLVLLGLAACLAVILSPAVGILQRRGLPRPAAVGLVMAAFLAAIGGILVALVPAILDGIDTLVAEIPRWIDHLRTSDTYREIDDRFGVSDSVSDQAGSISGKLGPALGAAGHIAAGALSMLFNLVTIIVLSAYLLLDGPRILAWTRSQLPAEQTDRFDRLRAGVQAAIVGYALAVGMLAIVAAIVTFIILTALGVPGAAALAAVMGLLSFVPMVGAPVAAILIGIVCVFESTTALVIWLVVFTVYNQIENHVLQPAIYKRTVQLHPLVVIPALIFAGTQFGLLGALVAVPVAAIGQLVAAEWWMVRRAGLEAANPVQAIAPHRLDADGHVVAEGPLTFAEDVVRRSREAGGTALAPEEDAVVNAVVNAHFDAAASDPDPA